MLFSSLTFLLVFLPLTLIAYFIIPNRHYRNIILLITSLIFYAWGEPVYIFLMIGSIIVNYYLALKIEKGSKILFILSLVLNVFLLILFKYSNFILQDILLLKSVHLNLTLPIGISFYTFQIISYQIDVYQKKIKAQHNLLFLGTYITMFPQLIAGPIVRYETIAEEMTNRKESFELCASGIQRFVIGLSKKILIANQVAIISDKIFFHTNNLSTPLAWLGAIAFTLQIYYDFSGYSDMAIGLGKIFGFTFNENFNYPYTAKTITDFWRRWHISLSSWFKDYVYIPMGGSRQSIKRNIFNLLMVWMLTGLWHGASYNFIIWGLFYGILLILEKYLFKNIITKIPHLYQIIALFLIIISWVIFQLTDIQQMIRFLKTMFIPTGSISINALNNMGLLYLWPYFLIGILGIVPFWKKHIRLPMIAYFILLTLCLILLVNNSYNPFIYFRF